MPTLARPEREVLAAVKRLRDARRARYDTIAEAAKDAGISLNTWKTYEQDNPDRARDVSPAHLMAVCRVLNVSPAWLVWGIGSRRPEESDGERRTILPIMGYIGAGAIIEPEFEQVPPDGLDEIELPIWMPSDDVVALALRGDSQLPKYRDGTVFVVTREQMRATADYIGQEAAVRTEDGRRYLKEIRRGRARGRYTLASFNAADIEDVKLVWVGEIKLIVPPAQARRLHGIR